METIIAQIGKTAYTTTIRSVKHELVSDEPTQWGGKDEGFSPNELLASSLGACTSITLKMYADRKQLELEEIIVKVTFERNSAKNTSEFKREITLKGNLTDDQKQRLLQIANLCPIHKALTNPIHIESYLTQD